jgi:hypothetical protein
MMGRTPRDTTAGALSSLAAIADEDGDDDDGIETMGSMMGSLIGYGGEGGESVEMMAEDVPAAKGGSIMYMSMTSERPA